MNMRRVIYIGILMLAGLPAWSQLVQVSGYIYQKETNQPIPYASIYNLRNRTGAASDISGFYTVLINPADSIRLTAIGFKEMRFMLPAGVTEGSFTYDVFMEKKVNVLDTVTVGKYNMDRFKDEFVNMQLPEEKKIITADANMLNSAKPVNANFGVHLNGPFSWLYNKFSRRSKELEKLRDLQEGSSNLSGSSRLNRELIKDVTGLKEEEIDGFMRYCQLPMEDLGHINNYDLRLMIRKCYDQYIAEHPPQPTTVTDSLPR